MMCLTFTIFIDPFIFLSPVHVHVVIKVNHTVFLLKEFKVVFTDLFVVVKLGLGAGNWTRIFHQGFVIFIQTTVGSGGETYIDNWVSLWNRWCHLCKLGQLLGLLHLSTHLCNYLINFKESKTNVVLIMTVFQSTHKERLFIQLEKANSLQKSRWIPKKVS